MPELKKQNDIEKNIRDFLNKLLFLYQKTNVIYGAKIFYINYWLELTKESNNSYRHNIRKQDHVQKFKL